MRGTAAERRVGGALRSLSLRHSTRTGRLPGRPDFILTTRPVAIFVDGCFWHGCPRCFVPPRHNRGWWVMKIAKNRRRDLRKDRALRMLGFQVIHLWEHDGLERIERRLLSAAKRSSDRRTSTRRSTGTR